jgi:hypothetical protein
VFGRLDEGVWDIFGTLNGQSISTASGPDVCNGINIPDSSNLVYFPRAGIGSGAGEVFVCGSLRQGAAYD